MTQFLRTNSGKLITLGLLVVSLVRLEVFLVLFFGLILIKVSPFNDQPEDNSEPEPESEGYPDWVKVKYAQVCNLNQYAGKSYDYICQQILAKTPLPPQPL